MKVGRIYKINVGVALLYFVIVLSTTILTMIMGLANQNNMALRIILCTCFSIVMIFISFENYKDGKSIFDKTIESKIINAEIENNIFKVTFHKIFHPAAPGQSALGLYSFV